MRDFTSVERRIKLHDVRILVCVVQAGSMSRAAERLATSQPAISRSIADLENALGVRLLERNPRGVEPTLYGRALIRRGLAMFDELREGIRDIEFLADPTAGEVRIAASIAVAVSLVSAVVDRLSRRYPRLDFRVQAVDSAAACRALEQRQADLAIVHMIDPFRADTMNVDVLYEEPLVVAAGLKSPWIRRRKLALSDLLHEPWTLPPADTLFGSWVVEAFRANGLDVPRTVVASSFPVRSALLSTGRFITMIPRVLLEFPARSPLLGKLPIDLPTTRRAVAILTTKGRTLSPVAQLFMASAREIAKPMAKPDKFLPSRNT